MKRRIVIAMLITGVMAAVGCGNVSTGEKEKISAESAEEIRDKENEQKDVKEENEILKGVYPNGGSAVRVTMGTYMDGSQVKLCSIDMPGEYTVDAYYRGEDEQEHVIAEASSLTLSDAEKKGFIQERSEYISYIMLNSFDEDQSIVRYTIEAFAGRTMDDLKGEIAEAEDIGTDAHEAFYYTDKSEYAASDITVIFKLNDDAFLTVDYEGAMTEKMGAETLAQNIYNLVETE